MEPLTVGCQDDVIVLSRKTNIKQNGTDDPLFCYWTAHGTATDAQ